MVLLLLLGCSIQIATAAEGYEYIGQWGTAGSGHGQFNSSQGVAVDNSGNVYVADNYNNRIQKFNSNGTFITQWGTAGSKDGQFNGPRDVAADTAGNVYVTDPGNYRVQKFTSTGAFVTKWGSEGSEDGQFNKPAGIAVDSVGNVYVTDSDPNPDPYIGTGNHRVQKFTSNGIFLLKFGSEGTGDGHFRKVNGVAVDSAGNVYVTDYYSYSISQDRVQKFTSSGVFIMKWGGYGLGNGQFYWPTDIAVDSVGDVYVVDSRHNRIQKFDASGNFITLWGSEGSGDGQFISISGVAVDSTGIVYVGDAGNHRVQKFSLAPGTPPASVTNLRSTIRNATSITWTWTDPTDPDFTKVRMYVNGTAQTYVPKGVQSYTATGLTPSTSYTLGTRTYDLTGNYGSLVTNVTSTTSPAVPLVAAFTASPTSGMAPLTVFFTDHSTGNPTSYAWKFGDGNTSSAKNPTHRYVTAGTYTVTEIVRNSAGSNSTTKSVTVTSPAVALRAAFTASVTSGPAPLTVFFTDKSTGNPTSYAWRFGDGTTSSAKNPTHRYVTAGTYTVTEIVRNSAGSNSTTKTVTVLADTTPPAPVTNLRGTSRNATSITWTWTDPADPDFTKVRVYVNGVSKAYVPKGVKSYTATGLTPSTSYTLGTRTYDLTCNFGSLVSNVASTTSSASSSTQRLVDSAPLTTEPTESPMPATMVTLNPKVAGEPLITSFSWEDPVTATVPVTFTDISNGTPIHWYWEMENQTSSTQNMTHVFLKSGRYAVNLTIENALGEKNTTAREVLVKPSVTSTPSIAPRTLNTTSSTSTPTVSMMTAITPEKITTVSDSSSGSRKQMRQ